MDSALATAKQTWMDHPNVNGIFKARKRKGKVWTDELSIQFHLKRKMPAAQVSTNDLIPNEIGGIPTDVIQANPRLGLTGRKLAAIQGGVSIGIEEQTDAGTLGCVVYDTIHGLMGVTCAHVLLVQGAHTPTLGQHVLYPAQLDGGMIGADRVGVPYVHGLASQVDSASFFLSYSYGLSILNTLAIPSGMQDPILGDQLQKVGRTSGLTNGQVSGTGYMNQDYSEYGGGLLSVEYFFLIPLSTDDPSAIIGSSGDSGALWYYPATGNAGGLHTAHDPDVNIVYASFFSAAILGAGIAMPEIPVPNQAELKGAMNLAVPVFREIKGAMNLSGSGLVFSTRITAFNQIGDYPALEDIYAEAGITFIPIGGTVPAGGTMPTGGMTIAPTGGMEMTWGDYDGAFPTE